MIHDFCRLRINFFPKIQNQNRAEPDQLFLIRIFPVSYSDKLLRNACPESHFLRFYFQNCFFFSKILSGTLSECRTVWIQIRTGVLSVLIWVQTVCKGYQQTTIVATSKGRARDIQVFKLLLNRQYSSRATPLCK